MQTRKLAAVAGAIGIVLGILCIALENNGLGLGAGIAALVAGVIGLLSETAPLPAAVPAPVPVSTDVAPAPAMFPDTGLFNEQYFNVMVDTRVSAAKRHLRPVSLVLVVVGMQSNGRIVPADRLAVAGAVRRTLREADIACELGGRLGFILEDTPEEGAIWTLERLRRALTEVDGRLVQWAGVACYPAHAFNAGEVLAKAEGALAVARDWPQARIEVASAS